MWLDLPTGERGVASGMRSAAGGPRGRGRQLTETRREWSAIDEHKGDQNPSSDTMLDFEEMRDISLNVLNMKSTIHEIYIGERGERNHPG